MWDTKRFLNLALLMGFGVFLTTGIFINETFDQSASQQFSNQNILPMAFADDDECDDDECPPTLVSAVPLSSSSIKLTWTHDQTPSAGYDIIIDGRDTNQQWRTTALMQTITGLDDDREYCFEIQARFTDQGEFPESNEMCATTDGSGGDGPTAPVLVSAETIDDESIKLIWTHDQTPSAGYDIIIDGRDTNQQWRTTALMQTITGLDDDREYCFEIQARFTDQGEFPESNEMCATTDGSGGNPSLMCNGKTVEEWEDLGYTKFVGNEKRNFLIGTNGNDIIVGLGGNDRIVGRGGDDIICGGDGKDLIFGVGGNDIIFGEDDRDIIFGNNGDDEINGGDDNDSLRGGTGDDTMTGGLGNDNMLGGNGEDVMEGNEGNDKLKGQKGDDILRGNEGSDELDGGKDTDICEVDDADKKRINCEIDDGGYFFAVP